MADVKYTHIMTDFLNDVCYAGGLGEEIEASSITTALSYINTSPSACDIYFESALSGPEWATLSGVIAAHDGMEPMVDAGLVLTPDGVGSIYWDEIVVISGAVTNVDLQQVIEVVATVSGAVDGAVAGITTLSGVVQNFIDNIYETITVTSGTLQDQIDDVAVSKVFSFALRDQSKDYFEVNASTWLVAASFPFPGTGVATSTIFEIIGSRNAEQGWGELRLYDVTNLNVIAEITYSTAAKQRYYDDLLQNLPSGNALFEVQMRKQGGGGADKIRIHSAILR